MNGAYPYPFYAAGIIGSGALVRGATMRAVDMNAGLVARVATNR